MKKIVESIGEKCCKCEGVANLRYGNEKLSIPMSPICYFCLEDVYPGAYALLPQATRDAQEFLRRESLS
jgi:hypothetical protein